jgi:hypothetical protein
MMGSGTPAAATNQRSTLSFVCTARWPLVKVQVLPEPVPLLDRG